MGLQAQLKKTWRLRVGASINLQNNALGHHDYYPLDDTPYGDETIYLEEVGVLDEIYVSKGYGQDQFDTTLYVPRTKFAYFNHPKAFIGFGLNGKIVLDNRAAKRNHFIVNFQGSLMNALNNKTTIEFQYYDYSRIGGGNMGLDTSMGIGLVNMSITVSV
ncbi:MAG: hypothetical protein ACI8SE_000718 [Bacteroidia bacterium]